MSITEKEIKHIAHLARLQIEEKDIPIYTRNLTNVLELANQINAIDVTGIEPMAHPLHLTQRLREDNITEHNQRELLQKNAPCTEAGLYMVPQVIEEG